MHAVQWCVDLGAPACLLLSCPEEVQSCKKSLHKKCPDVDEASSLGKGSKACTTAARAAAWSPGGSEALMIAHPKLMRYVEMGQEAVFIYAKM